MLQRSGAAGDSSVLGEDQSDERYLKGYCRSSNQKHSRFRYRIHIHNGRPLPMTVWELRKLTGSLVLFGAICIVFFILMYGSLVSWRTCTFWKFIIRLMVSIEGTLFSAGLFNALFVHKIQGMLPKAYSRSAIVVEYLIIFILKKISRTP